MTRYFWLYADWKRVKEISHSRAIKLSIKHHVVYVHDDGSIYSTRAFIPGKQLKQIPGVTVGSN